MPTGTNGVEVSLGHTAANGISASMFGLLDRGATKRPRLARELRGRVEFRFKEGFAPVRVTFSEGQVLVEDGDGGSGGWQPDLVISGSLPDVAHLAAAPQVAGIPKPTNRRGRAALARVAGGRVRISGNRRLARSLLRLLEI